PCAPRGTMPRSVSQGSPPGTVTRPGGLFSFLRGPEFQTQRPAQLLRRVEVDAPLAAQEPAQDGLRYARLKGDGVRGPPRALHRPADHVGERAFCGPAHAQYLQPDQRRGYAHYTEWQVIVNWFVVGEGRNAQAESVLDGSEECQRSGIGDPHLRS